MLFFKKRWELIAHGHSFVKSKERKLLLSLFSKEKRSKERWERFAFEHKKGNNSKKTVKKMVKTTNFFERITSESLTLIFFKSEKSDSLLVALFSRVTRVIHKQLLFFKERRERITLGCSLKIAILS